MRLLLLAFLVFSACVRQAPPPQQPVDPGPGPAATGDPLADAIARLDPELSRRGFTVQGTPVRGQLAAGAVTAYPIEAQPGLCYLGFALSAADADVDLFLYDPDGSEVGNHLAPGTPFVAYCPTRAGRHSLHVFMAGGQGPYVMALYSGSAPPTDLAQVFAAPGSGADPAVAAPVDPVIASRVSSRDRQLSRRGMTRVGAPSSATFHPGEARRVEVRLAHGSCYAFAALSGGGGQDLDLALFAPAGQRLERDDAGDANAFLRHCPLVSGAYQLEVRLSEGQGAVWLVSWAQGSQSTITLAAFDASGGEGAAAAAVPNDAARRAVDHEMRTRGYEPLGTPLTGQIGGGVPVEHELTLEAGKCYALTAAGESGVTDIDIAVFDRQTELGRDTSNAAYAVARVCPTRSTQARIQVTAAAGAGPYQLRPYVWPRSTQGPFDLRGAIFVQLSEATTLLGRDGYEPTTSPELGNIREGEPLRADVALTPGSCYALVATGAPEVRDLAIAVSVGSTVLATAERHEPVAIVRACAEARAQYRIELRSLRGSGQVLHQVFQLAATNASP